jgi:tRNA (guanine-N7-)-methyltransferase
VSSNLTAPTISKYCTVDPHFPLNPPPGSTPSLAAPENLVFPLRTILEPLDLTALFPKPQPLEVELGCGDASLTAAYAALHPERNFLGVERLMGRIAKLDKKGRRLGLRNLRGIRIESAYLLEWLLPEQSVAALHVYFPDPWPKKKHRRHRLINEQFPALARRVLTQQGRVYLRTDDQDYFEQMLAVFSADAAFKSIETPSELSAVVTDFEQDFSARGIPTLRTAYQLG